MICIYKCGGITQSQLMDFGFVVGDHNPIHFDRSVVAKKSFPKLLVHGMYLYSLAYKAMEEYLCKQGTSLKISELGSKFSGMTFEEDSFYLDFDFSPQEKLEASRPYKLFLKNSSGDVNVSFHVTLK